MIRMTSNASFRIKFLYPISLLPMPMAMPSMVATFQTCPRPIVAAGFITRLKCVLACCLAGVGQMLVNGVLHSCRTIPVQGGKRRSQFQDVWRCRNVNPWLLAGGALVRASGFDSLRRRCYRLPNVRCDRI